MISQIAAGFKRIKLGALYPTRDFNYVEDTCEAFLSVSKSSKTVGKVVNAASCFEISIGDTANLIAKVMDQDIEIYSDQERIRPTNSEVNRLFGDNSLLRELTDWEPKYGDIDGFERGLKKTVEWFTNSENLARYKSGRYEV